MVFPFFRSFAALDNLASHTSSYCYVVALSKFCEITTVILEEVFNYGNVYGLPNTGFETTGFKDGDEITDTFFYFDLHLPIKEVKKVPDIDKLVAELDEAASCGKPVEIDLRSMQRKNNRDFEVSYTDGLMAFTNATMVTKQSFTLPIKIELRAKTDRLNLNVGHNKGGGMTFNWDDGPNRLLYMNGETKEWIRYKNGGKIPADKFVDIEYILGKELVVVRVNGKLRHAGVEFQYIEKMKENPELVISAPVTVGTWEERTTKIASTMTVESLRITEW